MRLFPPYLFSKGQSGEIYSKSITRVPQISIIKHQSHVASREESPRSISLSLSSFSSLESIPGRRLESHQDPGATGGRRGGVFDLAGRSCKHALLEDVAAGGQFSSSIQADLGHGAAVDQLTGVIVLGGVLAAHHALLLGQGDVLIELLARVLLLPAPDGERFRHQRRSRYERHLLPREVVLLLGFRLQICARQHHEASEPLNINRGDYQCYSEFFEFFFFFFSDPQSESILGSRKVLVSFCLKTVPPRFVEDGCSPRSLWASTPLFHYCHACSLC